MSRQTSSLILHRISSKLAETTERLHRSEEHCAALAKDCDASRAALSATEAALAAAQKDAADSKSRLAAAERLARAEEERRTASENAMKQRNAELRASFLANEQAVARAEALAGRLKADLAVIQASLANACAACELRIDDVEVALRAARERRCDELRTLVTERRRLNASLSSLANYLAVRSPCGARQSDPRMAGAARRRQRADAKGRGAGGEDDAAEAEERDVQDAVVGLMGRAGEETYETLQRLWGEVVCVRGFVGTCAQVKMSCVVAGHLAG